MNFSEFVAKANEQKQEGKSEEFLVKEDLDELNFSSPVVKEAVEECFVKYHDLLKRLS